jgi:hypothetical protein
VSLGSSVIPVQPFTPLSYLQTSHELPYVVVD